ncbi:MAG: hypothetical protein WBO47_02810 [Gammaproteobacteria bacterium]
MLQGQTGTLPDPRQQTRRSGACGKRCFHNACIDKANNSPEKSLANGSMKQAQDVGLKAMPGHHMCRQRRPGAGFLPTPAGPDLFNLALSAFRTWKIKPLCLVYKVHVRIRFIFIEFFI